MVMPSECFENSVEEIILLLVKQFVIKLEVTLSTGSLKAHS